MMLELVHYFDHLVTIPLSNVNSLFSNSQTPLWQQFNFLEFVSFHFYFFWQSDSNRIWIWIWTWTWIWIWTVLLFIHLINFSQNPLEWLTTKISQHFTMAISLHFARCRKLHFKDYCCQLQSRNCTSFFFELCFFHFILLSMTLFSCHVSFWTIQRVFDCVSLMPLSSGFCLGSANWLIQSDYERVLQFRSL